jgi:tetratricopeptide (TPR) repeat protein
MSCDKEEEMQRVFAELDQFEKVIIGGFYNEIETNPNKIIKETELLIKKVKTDPDPDNIKWNKLAYLYDLRAETFYNSGRHKHSIEEIYKAAGNYQEWFGGEFSFNDNQYIHLACNYVKLKDYKKAKVYLDSADKRFYTTDVIWGNYYEVIGSKEQALKAYNQILIRDEDDQRFYYKDVQKRVAELKKTNPRLLTELFYPSDRPDEGLLDSEDKRRNKIFDLIGNLPEVKSCKECGISIYKEPKQTQSSKYWIKVGPDNGANLVSQFNFFVDSSTYEITFLDTKTDQEIRLEDWRKLK